MEFRFTNQDFARIGQALGVTARHDKSSVRYDLVDKESGRAITLTITWDLIVPAPMRNEGLASLVEVTTLSSMLQLQGCTGYIESQELGEVIFYAHQSGITNGLVVERTAGCSLYSNFDNRLLSTDFTKLDPALIMSSVALSMAEDIFRDIG